MKKASASPKIDRTIRLRDGRQMAYCEWGDLQGRPVVLLHGMPGSRLFCPDEEATAAAGVRLLTIDRPGYGRSDPRPARTLLDWADDYIELADQLDLSPGPVARSTRLRQDRPPCRRNHPRRDPIGAHSARPT